jgi:hypothetical protein
VFRVGDRAKAFRTEQEAVHYARQIQPKFPVYDIGIHNMNTDEHKFLEEYDGVTYGNQRNT